MKMFIFQPEEMDDGSFPEESEPIIYIDEEFENATEAFLVKYFDEESETGPTYPHLIVDAAGNN